MSRLTYLLAFFTILIFEMCIALLAENTFVRGILGDFLVVFLIYFFVQFIICYNPFKVALGVLLFAFLIEFLQFFKLIQILNLADNKIASTIIGTTFSFWDLVAYSLGIVSILYIELKLLKK